MARGTNLVRLIDMLRAEVKASLNPAHNRQAHDPHVHHLQQAQQDLWEDYEWPFLDINRDVQLLSGTYLYDPPTDLGLEGIRCVEVRWGGVWVPLQRGIGPEQYSLYDSALGEQSWPVERWRISEGDQIEVWPSPSDTGTVSDTEGYLRFTGKKKLDVLVDDDDRCTLDDRLIVLLAATNLVKGEDLQRITDRFKTRLLRVRGDTANNKGFRLYGNQSTTRELRGPPRVHYRVNET